jgi:hypothetical protein
MKNIVTTFMKTMFLLLNLMTVMINLCRSVKLCIVTDYKYACEFCVIFVVENSHHGKVMNHWHCIWQFSDIGSLYCSKFCIKMRASKLCHFEASLMFVVRQKHPGSLYMFQLWILWKTYSHVSFSLVVLMFLNLQNNCVIGPCTFVMFSKTWIH